MCSLHNPAEIHVCIFEHSKIRSSLKFMSSRVFFFIKNIIFDILGGFAVIHLIHMW